jgi:hypothetical protein
MSRQASLVTLALLTLAIGFSTQTGSAQVLTDYPVVGVSLPADCEDAPHINQVRGFFDETGIYDFWVYPILYPMEEIDAVRFGVDWSAEWTLLEVEICEATLAEGGITGPGSGVTLGIADGGHGQEAAIRMRINAASDGVLLLIEEPTSNELGYRNLDGVWFSYSPSAWVVIGETDICDGPWRVHEPTNFCLFSPPPAAGWVPIPPRLELPPATTYVDTLDAWSEDCNAITIPECNPWYPGPCLGTGSGGVEWLRFHPIDLLVGSTRVEMTVDTHALDPGVYTTRVIFSSVCGCGPFCRNIQLTVTPLPVESSTWGRIKGRHRD